MAAAPNLWLDTGKGGPPRLDVGLHGGWRDADTDADTDADAETDAVADADADADADQGEGAEGQSQSVPASIVSIRIRTRITPDPADAHPPGEYRTPCPPLLAPNPSASPSLPFFTQSDPAGFVRLARLDGLADRRVRVVLSITFMRCVCYAYAMFTRCWYYIDARIRFIITRLSSSLSPDYPHLLIFPSSPLVSPRLPSSPLMPSPDLPPQTSDNLEPSRRRGSPAPWTKSKVGRQCRRDASPQVERLANETQTRASRSCLSAGAYPERAEARFPVYQLLKIQPPSPSQPPSRMPVGRSLGTRPGRRDGGPTQTQTESSTSLSSEKQRPESLPGDFRPAQVPRHSYLRWRVSPVYRVVHGTLSDRGAIRPSPVPSRPVQSGPVQSSPVQSSPVQSVPSQSKSEAKLRVPRPVPVQTSPTHGRRRPPVATLAGDGRGEGEDDALKSRSPLASRGRGYWCEYVQGTTTSDSGPRARASPSPADLLALGRSGREGGPLSRPVVAIVGPGVTWRGHLGGTGNHLSARLRQLSGGASVGCTSADAARRDSGRDHAVGRKASRGARVAMIMGDASWMLNQVGETRQAGQEGGKHEEGDVHSTRRGRGWGAAVGAGAGGGESNLALRPLLPTSSWKRAGGPGAGHVTSSAHQPHRARPVDGGGFGVAEQMQPRPGTSSLPTPPQLTRL
ncbi:hypothetical protein JHW43_004959 [Diplocarpon mali]|nr:hypothetical protein JHW43_004959 [Diplocarpon mali]